MTSILVSPPRLTQPTVKTLPNGLTATFGTNPVAPGGTTTLTIGNTESLTAGAYDISISGTDGTESGGSDLILNISEAIPSIASLDSPLNMADGTGLYHDFNQPT